MDNFYEKLNASPWKGVISEVGLGLDFTSGLVCTPGASKTLISADCNYAKPDLSEPAVSLSHVNKIAKLNLEEASAFLSKEYNTNAKAFGLSISGAHYTHRDSHAWIYISTLDFQAYMHFSLQTNSSRKIISQQSAEVIQWFLNGCLLEKTTWASYIATRPSIATIDVLYAPGVSDTERLLLLGPDNLLAVKDNKFIRVLDALRESDIIYPGSFNPPTLAHLDLKISEGENILYEISQEHSHKMNISMEDILHRTRMLNLAGKTVLISRAAKFIDKNCVLKAYDNKDYTFLMGADVWNQLISRHQYGSDRYLGNMMQGTKFLIIPRPNFTIEQNGVSHFLTHKTCFECNSGREIDSSKIRSMEDPSSSMDIIPEIANYIKLHKLYA